jgi:hypothetical protein
MSVIHSLGAPLKLYLIDRSLNAMKYCSLQYGEIATC